MTERRLQERRKNTDGMVAEECFVFLPGLQNFMPPLERRKRDRRKVIVPKFVRCLWGDANLPGDAAHPRGAHKIRNDVRQAFKDQSVIEPAMIYVFGMDNYEFLKSIGYSSDQMVVLSSSGMVWPRERQFRHKLEVWKQAAYSLGEFVFLDWGDLWIDKPVPTDFWPRLRAKGTLQANLRYYHRKQLPWRKVEPRKVPSAAFVYMADPWHADSLLEIWDEHQDWTEQQCLAFHMDRLMGGWDSTPTNCPGVSVGLRSYEEKFAPYCCTFQNDAASAEFQGTKVELFRIK